MPLVFPSAPPPPLQSDDGVIATIEISTPQDKTWIVLPMATDNTSPIPASRLCEHALEAISATIMPDILALLCQDASITRIQVESMVPGGNIPADLLINAGNEPGLRNGGVAPSQIGLLMDWYVNPAQHLSGNRQRVGKNTFAGLSRDDINGDLVVTALKTLAETFLTNFMNGYADGTAPNLWYRVGKAVRQTGQALPLIFAGTIRDYLGTQRGRIVPH